MSEVIASLRADHANMALLLDALERELRAMAGGGAPHCAPDYDIVQSVLDYCLTYPDLYHHPQEDAVYERLRARRPDAAEDLAAIHEQHGELAALTRRLAAAVRLILQDAEVSRAAFGALAHDFLERYRRHMAIEEMTLFPEAERTLEPADWAAIEAAFTRSSDPLFGADVDERFAVLRRTVIAWAEEPS